MQVRGIVSRWFGRPVSMAVLTAFLAVGCNTGSSGGGTPANDPPNVGADQSLTTAVDTPLTDQVSLATDTEGDSLTYIVVTPPAHGTLSNHFTAPDDRSFTYTPNAGFTGVDHFTYKVNDGTSDSPTEATVAIAVANTAPAVGADQNLSTPHDVPLIDQVSAGSDADGDTLTYIVVTPPANGALSGHFTGPGVQGFTYTPNAGFVGADSFTYKVNDGAADSATVATVTIDVTNTAPAVGANQNLSTPHDVPLIDQVSAGSDAEGDTLTYVVVTGPTNGALSGHFTGPGVQGFTYTPNPGFVGADSFTYRVNDGFDDSATVATVTIDVTNTAPAVGANQNLATPHDVPLTDQVSAGSDVEGDALTYVVVTGPTNGALSNHFTGPGVQGFTYTPNPGFVGADSFTYVVNDGITDSATVATVTIDVTNTAPTVGVDQNLTTPHDTLLTDQVSAGTDAEGDALTYSVVTGPANGVLSNHFTAAGDRGFTYTPNPGFVGADSFTYVVNDGFADSAAVATVTIDVTNTAPAVGADQNLSTPHDTPLTDQVSAGTDADGDTLTYLVVTAPANGVLSNHFTGPGVQGFTYTPNAGFAGTDSFTYKVNDGITDSTAVATVTIDVTNTAPIVGVDQNLSTALDTPLTDQVSVAVDAEGDTLTYSVVTAPASGALSNHFTVPGDRNFTYTPNTGFTGTDSFTYRVNDGIVDSAAVATVTITVGGGGGNTPPNVGADQNFTMLHDSAANDFVSAGTDVDGDTLTYIVVTPPAHASNFEAFTLLIGDMSFLYVPTVGYVGTDSFTYKVNDGLADSPTVATVTFTITNQAPQVGPDDGFVVAPDTPLTAQVSKASDPDAIEILTYIVVTGPSNGALSNTFTAPGDRNFTYTPATGFTGTDTFTYKVNDGVVDSPTNATVTLEVGGAAIERVSVHSSGAQAAGVSGWPAVSADGRYVAFDSNASNLVTGDFNGVEDVFVHDRQTGATELVSLSSGGLQGNDDSYLAMISADGRYVAFVSWASNLVAGDTNGFPDIFVRDRATSTTERISVSSAGVEGDDWSDGVFDITANGRYVVFYSYASTLVAGDTNGVPDVFVRDRVLNTTERVSVETGGTQANNESYWSAISDDGRYVAFESLASNLFPTDSNATWDVFVHDRLSGITELVSATGTGFPGAGTSGTPSISADGRYVAFESYGDDIVSGDSNGSADVFVRDRQAGTTTLVSRSTGGTQGNNHSVFATLSATGRFVVFESQASNLTPEGTASALNVFLNDRQTGQTSLVSQVAGTPANDVSDWVVISADGRVMSFESVASNLVPGDTNLNWDAFATTNPAASFDPAADGDGDGLTNGDELLVYFTLYFVADSDGDGVNDGAEVTAGTDPLDPNDP